MVSPLTANWVCLDINNESLGQKDMYLERGIQQQENGQWLKQSPKYHNPLCCSKCFLGLNLHPPLKVYLPGHWCHPRVAHTLLILLVLWWLRCGEVLYSYVVVGHWAAGGNEKQNVCFFCRQNSVEADNTFSTGYSFCLSVAGTSSSFWLNGSDRRQRISPHLARTFGWMLCCGLASGRALWTVWLAGWLDAPTGQLLFLGPSFSYAVNL